ncbi:hypothetical protein [Costertonia aggregata]|uniref:Outer membrane beta-barrel protein n=1 Tax=Costertonia aggregata TaxID=343403 RepID=A0A7H9ASQ2_9FLAO|nr:hypothetical protein [Costertonia aggregata]QLG46437.1 hypothetical protein HYG79_14130 [Costertonia aggregata]
MKNILVLTAMLFFGCFSQAQVDRTNFRAGINGGLVMGDLSEAYSLNLGFDVYLHWGLSEEIDLGLTTGFSNVFGEKQTISAGGVSVETKFDNIQYLPLAASLRIYPFTGFKLGGDLGYAVGINSGNDGGLYYRPTIGVDINGSTELNVSYAVVDSDIDISSALVGILFLF